jgi:hypothetical protein
MGNLANTYLALGRPQDALALHEASLEFRRRVLPENHPDIGALRFLVTLVCFHVLLQALLWRLLLLITMNSGGTKMLWHYGKYRSSFINECCLKTIQI